MPSAANAKLEKQASTEAVEPIRQAIIVIDHKIRNLEKRKRKIESYQEEAKNGKTLNSDQMCAVTKFDEVLQTLDFARDLSKQFNGIAIDAGKAQKKLARKEALERAQQDVAKVKEILLVQDVLQNMGQENVREDFLAGRNGAVQLTEEELRFLDDLYSEVSPKHGTEEGLKPFQEQVQLAADHLLSIVEAKPKEIVGTTYAKLKELVASIHECGYFDHTEPTEEAATVEQPVEEEVEAEGEVAVAVEETVVAEQPPEPAVFPQGGPGLVAQSAAAVEPSYFSGAPAYAPAAAPTQPLNEFIGTVSGGIDFIQESELDPSEVAQPQQQRVQPTPPPSVAPIPTQTFTNQSFVAATTPSVVPQQMVYPPPGELQQTHIPGFATAAPNPPPPIPMPPSHHPSYSAQAGAPAPSYAAQTQQQPPAPSPFMQVLPTQPIAQQQQPVYDSTNQHKLQEPDPEPPVAQPAPVADDDGGDWAQADASTGDWSQPQETRDWNQQQESREWSQDEWSSTQNDGYVTQGGRGGYGRGRSNRATGRGSSNGYAGGRGGRGTYQNNRGGGGYGGGYRNNNSTDGGNNMYQNGYQQREGGSGHGYKRGGPRGGQGGAPRGGSERGQRGGSRGNPRGGRGNYIRGGTANKQ